MKKLLTLVLLMCGICFFQIPEVQAQDKKKEGTASYYHNKFNGRPTATGETFRNSGYTAASNHFTLGTYVKVTNKKNGNVVYVKINDRMGHPSRVIDLTERAAIDLNFKNSGITKVSIEVVSADEGKRKILAQNEALKSKQTKKL